jgi:hypothetical protein
MIGLNWLRKETSSRPFFDSDRNLLNCCRTKLITVMGKVFRMIRDWGNACQLSLLT